MTAGRAHSVLAAALADPALLARWRQEPGRLRDLGVDPEELDLDALWKFSGLALKVRHNKLRADLPLTFRLLGVSGLEIELFAAYASHLAGAEEEPADSTEERARQLIAFLELWHDRKRRDHLLLFDMIRHEWSLAQLSRIAPGPPDPAPQSAWPRALPDPECVPRVAGSLLLHEMACDPRELAAALRSSAPRLEGIGLGTRHFAYWRGEGHDAIHILELDELGFFLLSFADRGHSAAGLNRLLGGGERPSRSFLQALGELAATGVIVFD